MRKRGNGSLIWGGLLVALGLVMLTDNLGWLGEWNAPVGSLILAAVGLSFLATFASDRRQWWALIPGLAVTAIAVVVFLAEQELIAEEVVASIILAGIGLPFLLIFAANRRHWWALVPGMTMIGIAVAVFLEDIGAIGDAATGGIIVGGISLGFLSIYVVNRQHRWALFPGGILAAIACFLLLAAVAKFAWPAALILLGVLLLRSSLAGGRQRARGVGSVPVPARPERQRRSTLEEQIEAAVAEGPQGVEEAEVVEQPEPESPHDVPPAPAVPL